MMNRRVILGGGVGVTLVGLDDNVAGPNRTNTAEVLGPIDPWKLVDPELMPLLRRFISLTDRPSSAPKPSDADIARIFPTPLPPPAPQATERMIPGPSGVSKLRVIVVEPHGGGESRPALLHTHGGGFTGGAAHLSRNLQRIAESCSCVIVSVDYRLAPATPFPGSLEDNYVALRWLYHNAEELGVNPKKIAVGGESAGGGHAAILAIAARDRGEVPLIYQWLIYPMLDDRTGTSRQVPSHIGTFVWTREYNRKGWTAFLGVEAGSTNIPAGAVPARVSNLAGLPPAYIGVGSLDLFVQENIEYAARLTAAGVPVELVVVPGAFHGFDSSLEAEVSRRFVQNWLESLRKALA